MTKEQPVSQQKQPTVDGSGGASPYKISSRNQDNQYSSKVDLIAVESPVALVYNGLSQAVMMATPTDLDDFALGFSLTEGIVDQTNQIRSLDVLAVPLEYEQETISGYEVQMEIASAAFMKLKHRRRQLSGRTGCGICGLESLHAVIPDIQPVPSEPTPSYQAVETGIKEMNKNQALQAQSGAVHAAAWVDKQGQILALREDVGRHNALDKLLGAMAKKSHRRESFVLVSSRASFEMVTKCASQSIATLVAVSAATDLAVDFARRANMNLVGFIRPNRQIIYHSSQENA